MYPDPNQNHPQYPGGQQQPPQPQYSIDYLNQIAPQPQKQGLSNKLFLLIVGGGVVLAAVVGLLMLTSSSNGPTQKMQTLAARLQTLGDIAEKSQKSLKSGALRSTNSSLTILIANANREIADPLKKNGVDIKKLDKQIVAKENGDELTQTLEDARLNAVFDRTYAREMGYQLDTTALLMEDIYNSTKSQSLQQFLNATDDNLQPIKKQLTEFNAANG